MKKRKNQPAVVLSGFETIHSTTWMYSIELKKEGPYDLE
jgi:hypothetical protein